MITIISKIIGSWFAMGIAMWALMVGFLYLAIFSEKIADFFTAGK